ncbi:MULTISPECIES: flagellar assembly peptidoglycan hydrolase FlgJ [unclassified Neptuniibacter]|uniref:flagellar assembly peptidoglycan hydrolase FlgJ n=1 Tax=unclassified Neptuniibacter TaxID=2630693 RepID=UPI000C67A681|nr:MULTISPECIES: flagellar assembly peptidoglycan hydrolase FlgJ [unclassified Neptuniibacter]MAY42254.1 flagellar assembly peptidoglycan hydrolase FlgJ [Oceanospirillaceae bacterium]|tara:strand:- start:13962 stop:14999 length:1038 start_codon:yes stop_codon:yes gene_type:complete
MIKAGDGSNAQLYSDLAELQKLKAKARTDSDEGLRLAAQQFEQLFVNMLLKSMRDANAAFGEDNFMNSSQTKLFQGMYDNQIAMEMAGNKGIGLTDVLVRQLGGKSEPVKEADLKALDINSRRLNQAFDQAASVAATALLAKAEGQENPPGINLTDEQVNTVKEVFQQQLKQVTVADENLPDRFESPEEFVEKLMPLAEKVAGELGVDPRVLLAQSALETGWGRSMVRSPDGGNSNNLFNIKADRRWDGDSAQVSTLEFRNGVAQREKASFRSYESYEDSFRDYVNFLKNSPRYQMAIESAGDPYDYVRQLQEAGYATDPKYAEKIQNIFEGDLLASRSVSPKEG